MSKKKNRLPATLYVRKEEDGDEYYFIAGEMIDAIVEAEGTTLVGVYSLLESDSYKKVVTLEKE